MKQVPVREPVMHAAVHQAGECVEALAQAIVGIERYDILGAAAIAVRIGGTAGLCAGGVGILLIAVVRADQIQLWNDRVPNAAPEHL